MKKELHLYVVAPERDFLLPYLQRAVPEAVFVDSPTIADRCFMISSVDVYAADCGTLIDEKAAVDASSVWSCREAEFTDTCRAARKTAVILRAADIVGTGMTGWMRELAERIWKGTLLHFKGNEACVSVVHASDVAAAVAAAARLESNPEGCYNITDGDNPAFHDLVEALAFRMNNKHVSTLSTKGQLWLGRFFYGRRLYRRFTTTRTFDCSAFCRLTGFQPTAVVSYLRTHVYDESSL